jgi:hypothetical protein
MLDKPHLPSRLNARSAIVARFEVEQAVADSIVRSGDPNVPVIPNGACVVPRVAP